MTESRDLFVQLVLMFQMNAMQGMGKIKNPLTDRVDRHLDAAQFSIDLLDMLREKTRGNLSQTEERLLSQVLQDLKLNYVEEVAKTGSGGGDTPEPAQPETPQGGSPAAKAQDGGSPGERTPDSPGEGTPEGGPLEGKPS